MAASPVLVDSSWYIGVGRKGGDPLGLLESVAQARDVATCGIVRCEVARGVRSPKALRVFQEAWDVMLYVPTDNRLWRDVESTAPLDALARGEVPPHVRKILAVAGIAGEKPMRILAQYGP